MNASLKTFAAVGSLGLCLGFSGQASAQVFLWDQNGGFAEGSENVLVPANGEIGFTNGPLPTPQYPDGTPPGTSMGTYETINWLDNLIAPQSMLHLVTQGDGIPIPTGAGPQIITVLTHDNIIIPEDAEWNIRTDSFSKLRSPDGGTVIEDQGLTSVTINFIETTNSGACEDIFQGVESNNLAGSTCDDMYDVLISEISGTDFTFTWMGMDYEAVFGLLPGAGTAFEPITATAGPNAGQDFFRVYAREGESSVINVTLEINKIPEPSTLALMSLALAGFGYRASRKQK